MSLLPVPHVQQKRLGECLAACAAMVLEFLAQPTDYDALIKLLDIKPHGAWIQNLRRLEKLGVKVVIERGEVGTLRASVEDGLPPIAFVNTAELSYWIDATVHAVVVVGIDDEAIYLNDQAFADAPKCVPVDEFLLAWIDADQFYALIKLQ